MKFCHSCGTQYQEGTAYCEQCGAQLTQAATRSATVQDVVYAQTRGNQGKVHCSNPQCRSTALSPIVETTMNTTTRGSGYSGTQGCLGYLLFGPCGLLCGNCGNSQTTTTQSTNRTYWVCQDCGNKFRNLQDLEAEITKLQKRLPLVGACSAVMAICVVILWVCAAQVGGTVGTFIVWLSILVAVLTGIIVLSSFNQVKKLKQEQEDLLRNCFD